jgi:RNA polymerase sigma-70 factor, ECF subfamily
VTTEAAEIFEHYRSRLLAIGYRMLGSRADAEDCVQETWLRWQGQNQADVESPVAWLTTAMSRLCLDALRERRRAQASYPGPWLPEPWFEEPVAAGSDAAAELELSDDLSMAFLLLLERLAPEERAAFLLHEVFDVPYGEIAAIVDKQENTVRQTVARARKRVADERPRFRASMQEQAALANRFRQAVTLRDPIQLAALFKPDAVLISDGGGKALAALRPIVGAQKIAKFFLGITGKLDANSMRFDLRWMNDGISLMVFAHSGEPLMALGFDIRGEHIEGLYAVRNPDKLVGAQLVMSDVGSSPGIP